MPKYLITVRTIVEDRQTIEVDAPGRRQAIALAKRAAPRWHPTFLGVALGRGQHVKRVHGETRTILHVLSVMVRLWRGGGKPTWKPTGETTPGPRVVYVGQDEAPRSTGT